MITQEKQIKEFQIVLDKVQKQKDDMRQDKERFEFKHDEMFKVVSGLNARIEELEQHKLHLLSKLKSYGDRGDLSYIIKTQKIDVQKTNLIEDL